ncbi:MAG: sensor domain-containing diguanylate cyclase [Motiliproteus sp.]|nr:sensor domain-containing diguanylate cyclase [Motiliproteus sp.]MCW9053044.1 sensor domain-containing diguanylate cyclase [Motiliproteus sp.]
MSKKPPFLIITTMMLVLGFTATSLVSYFVANNSLNQHIRTNTLPLTSDNIYSEIQRDMLQPVLVASLMAQDTFVQDWVLKGEQDSTQMVRYLQAIQQRYKTVTAFFVSENSRNYYHSTGVLKQVEPDNPQDQWYFDIKKLPSDFEINLDTDTANINMTTLFVNHKIHDKYNNYLGAIGVGLASETIIELIETYQSRYGRQIYFINRLGQVTLKGQDFSAGEDIRQTNGLKEIATRILTSPSGSYEYSNNGQQYFIKTRFVPELNWYLIVEHQQKTEQEVQNALWINLALSLLVTVIVLLLVHFSLGRYQRRLEQMASTDLLTGTASRHAFEATFSKMLSFSQRNQHPLTTVLVDIDQFKQLNDNYGHLLGDHVLRKVAEILTDDLRHSDTICRWGGDEFLIILPECDIQHARIIAEDMRRQVEQSLQIVDGQHTNVTASFGLAEYDHHESSENLFKRTDEALYQTKSQGRNRVTDNHIQSNPKVKEAVHAD